MYEYERNRRDKPKCCKDCEYYQPRWKYRFCYFVRCPYKLKDILGIDRHKRVEENKQQKEEQR